MLHPTHHHPFLFKFNPFSQSLSPHFVSSPSSRFQEMESVDGDLRSGFGPETEAVMDDVLGVKAEDDFFVDELLDFSNGYCESTEEEQSVQTEGLPPEKEHGKEKESMVPPESGAPFVKDDFESLHESEFGVQEGLESLEWLSQFVEESFSDYSLTGKLPPENKSEAVVEVTVTVQEQPCFTTPVQTKARTKRARSGVRVWPVLSPSFTESSTSSSSSASSTTSFSLSQTDYSSLGQPPAKKHKKKPAEGGGAAAAQPRRCTHCGVTKTPQWRAGPLGAKTLCNACGVRFKSGRLLPEYRPACSPTFSSELHSNNHRKVLEMRRKKEEEMEATGLAPPVQSF